MHLIKRQTCRVCGSKALTSVIDLGEQHLQGSFIKPGKEIPPLRKISTSLVRCDPMRDEKACGLLQMEYTIPPEILYSSYWYRSGTNNTMRTHLQGIVNEVLDMTGHTESKTVLDIGCNDGTLLAFYPTTFKKFGVDPSDVAQEIKDPVKVIQDIFPSAELITTIKGQSFDIITSIAMFYDLEDPVSFVHGLKQVLSSNGVWVFEMSYMPTMLEMTSYDTICHEHIEYYSLAVIEHILRQEKMKIVNVEQNEINGGSLRCYATHINNFDYHQSQFKENVKMLRQKEFDLQLDTDIPYRHFQDRINVHKEELFSMLNKLKNKGKSIHIYGASTKGNTLLQWCGIDNKIIDCAADRNPDKFGALTLGTDIPIVSEQESRAMNPDYYLVLPWHFKEEFLQREKETLERGIGLIFPLPKIEIVQN